jgi:hypothetical protein
MSSQLPPDATNHTSEWFTKNMLLLQVTDFEICSVMCVCASHRFVLDVLLDDVLSIVS